MFAQRFPVDKGEAKLSPVLVILRNESPMFRFEEYPILSLDPIWTLSTAIHPA